MGDERARDGRAVALGVALTALIVVAVVNVGATARLDTWHRPVRIADSPSLTDLTIEHPLYWARYNLYLDLRSLGTATSIVVPHEHALDESALEALSGLSVVVANYRSDVDHAGESRFGGEVFRGVFEGRFDLRGSFVAYTITESAVAADRLRLFTHGDELLIAADTSASQP